MKEEQLNTDKIFRDKLKDHSVEPPAHVWDGVQGQMKTLRRKKVIAFYSRIAAAAVVILAFLAGWYFNEKTENTQPEIVQNQPAAEKPMQNLQPGKNEIADSLEQTNEFPAEDVKSLLASQEKKEPGKKEQEEVPVESEIQKPEIGLFADVKRAGLESLSKIKARVFYAGEADLAEVKEVDEEQLSADEKRLIAENSLALKSNEKETGGWKMGLNVSPGYSSHESSHSNVYAQNMTYKDDEGTTNIGGGISVQYKTSKRLSVESGVYYSQNGQKSGNSRDLFAFAPNAELDYALAPSVEKAYFNTAVQLRNNQIAMNSTAGVIEFDELPEGAVLAANPEADAAFSNTLLSNGEFSQVFDFVEIPLYLRYLVIDSKIDVEVLGGINAGLVVGNNAYMKNENGTQNIGKTKDISPVNMSGTIGIGVNYALGKKISLAVEPRFNYYLNSINSNPDVEYRPYRVGIFTGLYYDF